MHRTPITLSLTASPPSPSDLIPRLPIHSCADPEPLHQPTHLPHHPRCHHHTGQPPAQSIPLHQRTITIPAWTFVSLHIHRPQRLPLHFHPSFSSTIFLTSQAVPATLPTSISLHTTQQNITEL
ncbi:hypothetical protein AAC387_Pa05g1398 [Persea americana]